MKILLFLDALTYMRGATGGVRRYAQSIKSVLEQEGHTCDWCFNASMESLETYDVIHVFSSFYPNLRFFRIALKKKPIVISPIYDPSADRKWLIKSVLISSKLPGLHSNHAARREMVSSADFVFTMSAYEKKRLENDYSINFDSTDLLLPTHYKSSSNLTGSKDLIFVGDIGNPRQNIKRLIKALNGSGLSLTLIGSCSDTTMKKFVEKFDYVHFLGVVDENTKLESLKEHKAFVMPAYTSGFGMGAVEAAELGLIVVYTKFGGTSNYINSSGISIDPFSESDIRRGCLFAAKSRSKGCLIEHQSKDILISLMTGYKKAIESFDRR